MHVSFCMIEEANDDFSVAYTSVTGLFLECETKQDLNIINMGAHTPLNYRHNFTL